MSSLAEELDRRLQHLDPERAQVLERMLRSLFAMLDKDESAALKRSEQEQAPSLADLAEAAEPMGVLSNDEIDGAIYGR